MLCRHSAKNGFLCLELIGEDFIKSRKVSKVDSQNEKKYTYKCDADADKCNIIHLRNDRWFGMNGSQPAWWSGVMGYCLVVLWKLYYE